MCTIDVQDALHPERFSHCELLKILLERKVKVENMEFMPFEDLIQIYNQFCLPCSQRKYRDTLSGKLLSQQQQEREKQIKNNPKMAIKRCAKQEDWNSGNRVSNAFEQNVEFKEKNKRKYDQMFSIDSDTQPVAAKKQRAKITWP